MGRNSHGGAQPHHLPVGKSRMIRIASAQGYWGDWPQAPGLQVRSGPIDYLVFDYLAEVTMSILQKQRRRDPLKGYATDFVDVMMDLLPDLLDKKIRVISNAGGVNPIGCAKAILEKAAKLHPGRSFKVGVVHGDDILDRLDTMEMRRMDPASPKLTDIRDRLISANVYIGVEKVVDALKAGADIVVCGRVTDTALTLAPIVEHFNVPMSDLDALATGIVAGHILECGAQASGGNFLGRMLSVEEMIRIGYPIAEVHDPHSIIITKHESLGGEVSLGTVKEQLLYEIGDPREYITPDVTVDFTSIQLEDAGKDRVRVHGIKGSRRPDMLKVSCSYQDGWVLAGTMVYTWPNAVEKARAAGELVLERAKVLGLELEDVRIETIGASACHEGVHGDPRQSGEVTLRVAVRGHNEAHLNRLGQEIVPLVLTGPPGATGFAGGRPKPREVLAYWPALISREEVIPKMEVYTHDGIATMGGAK